MGKPVERQLRWNRRSTERHPAGTETRVGDISFVIQQTKTKAPKWRLYMEIHTRKEFGVKDDRKRGVCVAEYDGTLSLKEVHREVEKYLTIFIGMIMREWTD